MRRHWRIGLAWLGATALSVLIASAAVAGIRDRVVETPVAIGLPSMPATSLAPGTVPPTSLSVSTTTTVVPETTTTTTTTTVPPATTTTVTGSTVTTTTAPPATTTTTAPPATTSTTTTAAPLATETWQLTGGTVTLSFGNGEVNLVSAVPRPGFVAEYEDTGPREVEIKFESDDHKSKLEAHMDGGELKVEIEDEPHGDDDD